MSLNFTTLRMESRTRCSSHTGSKERRCNGCMSNIKVIKWRPKTCRSFIRVCRSLPTTQFCSACHFRKRSENSWGVILPQSWGVPGTRKRTKTVTEKCEAWRHRLASEHSQCPFYLVLMNCQSSFRWQILMATDVLKANNQLTGRCEERKAKSRLAKARG